MDNEPDSRNDRNGSATSWLVFGGGALVGASLVTLLGILLDAAPFNAGIGAAVGVAVGVAVGLALGRL